MLTDTLAVQREVVRSRGNAAAVQPACADPVSPMVRGAHGAIAVALVWSRVAWLAVRARRVPVGAAKALWRLRAARGRAPHWAVRKLARASGRYFWDLYSPGWPSAAFDHYVDRELARFDSRSERHTGLQTVVVAMTRRCSLRCEHCFEWNALQGREALPLADLREILRRLQRRGVAQLFFSGGEPLQRFDDLLELTACAAAESDVWILSSGQGLTAERAVRLRAAGLTGVALSLDHWDAAAHDRFRGFRGAYDAVAEASAHARGAGLLVALTLCPTRAFVSAGNLERYARTARGLGASFIQVMEPRPVGRYAGRDVALEPAQQRELERFTERLNHDPAARDFPAVTYLDWFARTHGCRGAGDRYAYIDTDGVLRACPFCRGGGVRMLDHDIDVVIAKLQDAGCTAGHDRDPACAGERIGPPVVHDTGVRAAGPCCAERMR